MLRLFFLGIYTIVVVNNAFAEQLDIKFTGTDTTVFKWQSDQCEDIDIPDNGLKAFKRADGKVVGLASHYVTRELVGDSLQTLKKASCKPVFVSAKNPDPKKYDDETWLSATWTEDGKNIAAIGHHEYHGEMHPGMCKGKTPRECWYGSFMLYASHDSGANFVKADAKPIVSVSIKQNFNQGKEIGFTHQSNIFEFEGFKYIFVRSSGGGAQTAAECLLRSKNPLEATSWEIYDGKSFKRSLFDPYQDDPSKDPVCAHISNLKGLVWSVVRHRKNNLLIALLTILDPVTKQSRLATSVSHDVLNWSKPRTVDGITFDWAGKSKANCSGLVYHYPSLLDPDATGRNFDNTDDDALLFLTTIHQTKCKMTMNRDLIYRPVKLSIQ